MNLQLLAAHFRPLEAKPRPLTSKLRQHHHQPRKQPHLEQKQPHHQQKPEIKIKLQIAKVSVSSTEPMTDAVGKIIASKNTADLNISNYRVNFNNGTATVDFRVPPDSPRQLVSLSSCEQFTLFKSIEKTLTSNPKWNVKNVRFTQSGEEIYL